MKPVVCVSVYLQTTFAADVHLTEEQDNATTDQQ
jgi:hypothetical protein